MKRIALFAIMLLATAPLLSAQIGSLPTVNGGAVWQNALLANPGGNTGDVSSTETGPRLWIDLTQSGSQFPGGVYSDKWSNSGKNDGQGGNNGAHSGDNGQSGSNGAHSGDNGQSGSNGNQDDWNGNSGGSGDWAGATTTTPEPSSLALLGTGLFGLTSFIRRRKKD